MAAATSIGKLRLLLLLLLLLHSLLLHAEDVLWRDGRAWLGGLLRTFGMFVDMQGEEALILGNFIKCDLALYGICIAACCRARALFRVSNK